MRPTLKSVSGTSFHGSTISATKRELIQILGQPESGDQYKVQNDWAMELGDRNGTVFTVYDWKEPRIGMDRKIDWHIRGYSKIVTEKARRQLLLQLSKLRKS